MITDPCLIHYTSAVHRRTGVVFSLLAVHLLLCPVPALEGTNLRLGKSNMEKGIDFEVLKLTQGHFSNALANIEPVLWLDLKYV